MRTVYYTESGSLDSSALSHYWYDYNNKELYLKFHSDNIAGYKNVPLEVVDTLLKADSAGAFYSRNIRPRFGGVSSDVEFVDVNVSDETIPANRVVDNKQSFLITAKVNNPLMSFKIDAESMEDALEQFRRMSEGLNFTVQAVITDVE